MIDEITAKNVREVILALRKYFADQRMALPYLCINILYELIFGETGNVPMLVDIFLTHFESR